MKNNRFLFLLLLLPLVSQAKLSYEDEIEFSRFGKTLCPVTVYYQHEGQIYQQVGVSQSNRPQIVMDGELKSLKSLRSSILQPARAFWPGYIEVLDSRATVHGTEYSSGDVYRDYTSFRLRVKSRDAVENLNVAFVAFDSVTLSYLVVWSRVGKVEAGKSQVVRLAIPPLTDNMMSDGGFVPLFFEGNREILSNRRKAVGNYIINQIVAKFYKKVVASRMAKGQANLPPLPYMTPMVQDLKSVRADGAPQGDLFATFTIQGDGHVTDVIIEGDCAQQLRQTLKRNIKKWIYLPAMKNGSPVSRRVKLPLKI